jgi:hypothetical protein
MLKSQTVLNETKWLARGVKSSYDDFLKLIKEELIELIDTNEQRYLRLAEEVYDKEQTEFNARYDEFKQFFPEKYGAKSKPPRAEKIKEINELMRSGGLIREFSLAHHEYVVSIKNNIRNAFAISDLVDAHYSQLDTRPVGRFRYSSPGLTGEYKSKLYHCIVASFTRTYRFLWPVTLQFFNENIAWLIFLDEQQHRLSNQKDVFRFYWTIYKGFQKKAEDESKLEDSEKPLYWKSSVQSNAFILKSLIEKCISSRIKLWVDKTEYEMIQIVETEWIPFTVKSKPVFWTSNAENFVKDVFICRDSVHSTKTFDYRITIECAAHFILLMRHLYYTSDLFSVTHVAEHKADSSYKKIEFQLWLEFTFRSIPGFGEDNIERYFTDSEENMKGFEHYAFIKKNFQNDRYGKI